jgi:phospholipase C
MAAVMPQIKNIVYLMLENRSLDNLLGWLYEGRTPRNFYPRENKAPYDGLIAGRYYNPAHSITGVHRYPVVPLPANHQMQRVPAYDPYEAMREGAQWNGVMNQLFGNQDAIQGMPKKNTPVQMLGFLQDYYARYMVDWQGLDILWTYTPSQLRYINSLAYQFAVSDRWFSSVPTQTNPNRAYSICGTSLGREANSNLLAIEQFNIPTVFNKLADAGKTWGLYYEVLWQEGKCYTEYTFPQITAAQHGEVGTIDRFKTRARAGTLPAFTYLEPKWGYGKGIFVHQGNDYHPPTLVAPGDQFLWDTYQAVRSSPQWANTLFIVSFDEHGGTYDHLKPTWSAINPDGINGTKWGFDFELYGARVPTLLISPYVARQTVFREPQGSKYPYDHTSLIKTLLLWAGVDPSAAGLGKRVPAAPSFDGVLSSTPVNTGDDTLRPVALEMPIAEEPTKPTKAPAPAAVLNDLFEGMPFTSIRAIMQRSRNIEDVQSGIAEYKDDPGKFESELKEGSST